MSDLKHYLSKESAQALVNCVKMNFSPISHKHTKDEIVDLDILETLVLMNQRATEANASALTAMQTDIESLAVRIRENEENLANFIAISSDEVHSLF